MSKPEALLRSHAKIKGNIQSWLIMLPGLLLMTFFVWEPLFESIRMSLYKTRNVELVKFIGFSNFISVTGKEAPARCRPGPRPESRPSVPAVPR